MTIYYQQVLYIERRKLVGLLSVKNNADCFDQLHSLLLTLKGSFYWNEGEQLYHVGHSKVCIVVFMGANVQVHIGAITLIQQGFETCLLFLTRQHHILELQAVTTFDIFSHLTDLIFQRKKGCY